jgi:hypothetical protein
MIENILLVSGPLNGQKRCSGGGDVLFLPSIERSLRRLVYRRARADS